MRLSHAHPLTIAVWRVAFTLPIIAAAMLATGGWRQWARLDRRGVALAFMAGAMLALHFWSWNASIGLTTVAASVVLVDTQPLLVAVLSLLWLREPPSRRQWMGIAVATAGALIVVYPHLAAGRGSPPARNALLGDFLALVGAATAAVYYVCGRRLRATLDLWAYVGLVYGMCFLVLLVLIAIIRPPLGNLPAREWALFAGLAIGPMLVGHTGLNWTLKFLPAYVVNVTTLGEPVIATLLAALLPGIRELPSAWTVVGGAIILGGIYLTLAERSNRRSA